MTDEEGNFWTLPELLADLDSQGNLYLTPKMCKDLAAMLRANLFQKGDLVIVAFDSGHIEEGTVEAMAVWVKDATGHSYECTPSQIRKIDERAHQDHAS